MVRQRKSRWRRILIGIGVMIVLVAGGFAVLSHYAGGWGVPYFSFVTDRGSTCTNDFTGYHCDKVTVSDIQWWADIALPDSTTVLSSHYKSTSDFTLDAVVMVPKVDAAKTVSAANKTFGRCQPSHPTQLDTNGLKSVCVRANDANMSSAATGPFANTLYEITTGTRPDGSLIIGIHEASR